MSVAALPRPHNSPLSTLFLLGQNGVTGQVVLAPPSHAVVGVTDELLVLAADDDSYAPGAPHHHWLGDAGTCPGASGEADGPERILMCGWRRDIDDIIAQLDTAVHPGSTLVMLSEEPIERRDMQLQEGGLVLSELQNLRIEHVFGNSAVKRQVSSRGLECFAARFSFHAAAAVLCLRGVSPAGTSLVVFFPPSLTAAGGGRCRELRQRAGHE